MNDTQEKIKAICKNMEHVLIEKNIRYGDSALSPIKIFSKDNATNNICTRLDDKMSRIKNSNDLRKNDIFDTMGYLVLLLISKDWTNFDDLLD